MTAPLMPLAHAADALDNLVVQFCNEMRRSGIMEMPAKDWAVAFRDWISEYDFERQYEETVK